MEGYKTLPTTGYIRVTDLGDFLDQRVDRLQTKLRKLGVPMVCLSTHSRMQMVDVADLKILKDVPKQREPKKNQSNPV